MNINIVGFEYIPTYLAIIFATFCFSFFFWKLLYLELDIHNVKYTNRLKRRSLWLIFSSILSLMIWLHVLQLLLSRLQ